jgi:GT2 family glycosyltransferase
MAADVTIIIPQFNRCDLTRRCVTSLMEMNPQPPPLLVADDGSAEAALDPDLTWLSSHARVLRLPHQGVTAAWNAAAQAAQTRWLIFLNNDALSLGPWIDRLLEPLRMGAAEMTGVEWRLDRDLPPSLRTLLPQGRLLAGWCFAIARHRWLDLGGFDPSLALYFSDTDLQLRLLADSAKASPLLGVEGLPLIHAGHATTRRLPDRRRQWRRDRDQLLAKWNALLSPANADQLP